MTTPDRQTDAPACLPDWRLSVLAEGEEPAPAEAEHLAACQTCRAALDAARDESDLLAGVAHALAAPAAAPPPESDAPDGYRFIEEIHRGAQGVVYLAEQIAAKRLVAVKLTLRGAFASSRQRARFDREVELAASITHHAVVTVYESGATPSGGRYMAMELVDGLPLDRWFDSRRREPPRVARVMSAIAGAVEAAHRKGVIHRDLKPSNILVDSADDPKLVDFGIAKALAENRVSETQAGEFVGTLAYAAPEQVAGDPAAIDTRVDVYALGALLYEGLTGARPVNLEGSLETCLRRIRETPPAPPDVLDPAVPRDLAAIALQALEKDPARRYQTAGALRDDLDRYLAGDAVLARGHDSLYRFRKWAIRRRRTLAAAAVAIAALAVTAGLAASAYLASQREAWVGAGLIKPLQALDTELSNERVVTLNDYLRNMAAVLASDLPQAPDLEAAVRSSIGLALTRESAFEGAEAELTRALELWRDARGPRAPETAQALHNLARMHWKASDYRAAEPLYREALEIRRDVLPRGDLETARTAHHLASTVQRLGRFDEAVALYEEAFEARRAALGPDDPSVANTLNSLGESYFADRRFEQALVELREARRIVAAAAGEEDWRTASVDANIARCLVALGRPAEARDLFQSVLRINERWWPESDRRVLGVRLSLAAIEQDPGEIARLQSLLRDQFGADHALVATASAALAEAALAANDPQTARGAAAEASRLVSRRDPESFEAAELLLIEAEACAALRRRDEAARLLAQARDALGGRLSPGDPLHDRLSRVSAAVEAPPPR